MIIKLKIKILIPLLLIVSISGAQQRKILNIKRINNNHRKMKVLDINEQKLIENQKLYKLIEYKKSDSIYQLVKEEDGKIRKTSSKFNENLRKVEIYDNTTNLLKSEGYFFGDIAIGQYIEYDLNGKIVKSINYDEKYNLSIDDFIALIRTTTGIDITLKTAKVMDIIRSFDNSQNLPFYSLTLYVSGNSIRNIKVNANNGKIYYDAVSLLTED